MSEKLSGISSSGQLLIKRHNFDPDLIDYIREKEQRITEFLNHAEALEAERDNARRERDTALARATAAESRAFSIEAALGIEQVCAEKAEAERDRYRARSWTFVCVQNPGRRRRGATTTSPPRRRRSPNA